MKRITKAFVLAGLGLASLAAIAQGGQTVNMNLGQASQLTFTVTDNNGKPVPAGSYSVSATFSDPTIAQYNPGGIGTPPSVSGLKLGTTTVTWTISGNGSNGYNGSVNVGPDTINVNPKTVASASVAYGTPQ